jgi:hypothetical protein
MKLTMISTTNMATTPSIKVLFVLGVAATLFGLVRMSDINFVLCSNNKEDLPLVLSFSCSLTGSITRVCM